MIVIDLHKDWNSTGYLVARKLISGLGKSYAHERK